ncbi:universal stress protein, partial [Nonomuraea fuscirosea]|uniref:universal stress protein n=1 Tax=Nonomuraea fuscirosea TaxID=1291556 RepID=UPI0034207465
MAYRTVLVGTDGSASSFRAVSAAASLAAATGATLVLTCAYLPMRESERAAAADRLGELAYKVTGSTPADDALRAAREHAVAAGATDVVLTADQGDAVDVLIAAAARRSRPPSAGSDARCPPRGRPRSRRAGSSPAPR